MGYKEAVEDNIKFRSGKSITSITAYYPKCHICGKEVLSYSYIRGKQYTCKDCKLDNYLADKEIKNIKNLDKKEQKFEKAVARITKTVGKNINKYEKAIDIVHKKLHKDNWFDSTEEIMTAIELVKNKVKARHQVKVGRYRIDFVLPDEKIILEIDGRLFHTDNTLEKEKVRDNLLLLHFGVDWEVIRITDDYINQNIKRLVPAIRRLKDERARIRKQNDGILPEWYSKKDN